MVSLPPKNVKCPYTGHKKSCASLALNCPKFIHMTGENPANGQPIDQYGCADAFTPLIMTDLVRKTNEVGAAFESFRNAALQISRARAEPPQLPDNTRTTEPPEQPQS